MRVLTLRDSDIFKGGQRGDKGGQVVNSPIKPRILAQCTHKRSTMGYSRCPGPAKSTVACHYICHFGRLYRTNRIWTLIMGTSAVAVACQNGSRPVHETHVRRHYAISYKLDRDNMPNNTCYSWVVSHTIKWIELIQSNNICSNGARSHGITGPPGTTLGTGGKGDPPPSKTPATCGIFRVFPIFERFFPNFLHVKWGRGGL